MIQKIEPGIAFYSSVLESDIANLFADLISKIPADSSWILNQYFRPFCIVIGRRQGGSVEMDGDIELTVFGITFPADFLQDIQLAFSIIDGAIVCLDLIFAKKANDLPAYFSGFRTFVQVS